MTKSIAIVTDEQIMMAVKEGAIDKTAILFERYHIGIYNYFLHSNMDMSQSEDLTQNVFERMIKYRNSFRNDSKFKGWIFTIARNVKMDHYRTQKIKIDEIREPENIQLYERNMEEHIEALEDQSRLRNAIEQLEGPYREILYLTRFEEMKYKEVATLLKCTENTVKSKVHRAINKLRTIYFQMN